MGHEPEEENYFAYSATLRISGENMNFDEISQEIGITPTYTHKKGEIHGKVRSIPWKEDMWMFDTPIKEEQPLEDHINTLWGLIKDKKDYIQNLKSKYKVDVFLGYRSNCDTAGIKVPHGCLEMFIQLEIPFGLSIVIA